MIINFTYEAKKSTSGDEIKAQQTTKNQQTHSNFITIKTNLGIGKYSKITKRKRKNIPPQAFKTLLQSCFGPNVQIDQKIVDSLESGPVQAFVTNFITVRAVIHHKQRIKSQIHKQDNDKESI